MWRDLAEVRTLAIRPEFQHQGIGAAILRELLERAKLLGTNRVFCLTFETDFFGSHGFKEISNSPIDPNTYAELVRSTDEGIAEFLDLARVKQNTLGNTRMLKQL
jgi:amino-acid N-acetyltransferase